MCVYVCVSLHVSFLCSGSVFCCLSGRGQRQFKTYVLRNQVRNTTLSGVTPSDKRALFLCVCVCVCTCERFAFCMFHISDIIRNTHTKTTPSVLALVCVCGSRSRSVVAVYLYIYALPITHTHTARAAQ